MTSPPILFFDVTYKKEQGGTKEEETIHLNSILNIAPPKMELASHTKISSHVFSAEAQAEIFSSLNGLRYEEKSEQREKSEKREKEKEKK